ncbi:MAG: Crp/Fnr family transcriptional regulator [Bacteroidia bacterium]
MREDNKIWFQKNVELFQHLPHNETESLLNKCSVKEFKKSEILFFPEDESNKIYVVKSGKVKVSKLSNKGKELILSIYTSGDIFGELSISNQGKSEEIAEAITTTEVYIISTKDFISYAQKNAELAFSLAKLIAIRSAKIQKRLESLYFKNTEERIKSFIREMANEHGRKLITGDEIEVNLKLKHEDIAKLTATTRQSVTTVLSQLEKDGIILYDRNRILVKRMKSL